MQVVILAAGKGTRMGSLVLDRPKPMLVVAGKTLLEHKFDALPDDVEEIILIVGYLENVIRGAYGDAYKGRRIRYVTQSNPVGGTADALWQARPYVHEKFLVLNGDDVYVRADLDACRVFDWALLTKRVSDLSGGAKVVTDIHNRVIDIIESSHHGGGAGAMNTGMCALDTRIFDFPQVPKAEGSTELGLPQTIIAASRTAGIPLHAVEATRWIQITNPEDIQQAETILSKDV